MNDRQSAAERLCTACGLCCDGSLFAHVTVTRADLRRAGVRALPLLTVQTAPTDGPPDEVLARIAQPCPALIGTRCDRYDVRPERCRAFRCLLLTALDEGEVDLPEALRVVSDTRQKLSADPDSAWADRHEREDALDRLFRGRSRSPRS